MKVQVSTPDEIKNRKYVSILNTKLQYIEDMLAMVEPQKKEVNICDGHCTYKGNVVYFEFPIDFSDVGSSEGFSWLKISIGRTYREAGWGCITLHNKPDSHESTMSHIMTIETKRN